MKKRKTNYVILALVVVLLLLAVGYAAFSQTLNITGTANAKAEWVVRFDNPKIDGTTDTSTEDGNSAVLSNSDHTLTVEVTLTKPGESKTVTVDIVNEGSLAAKLTTFTVTSAKDVNNGNQEISATEGGVYTTNSGNIKMTLAPMTTGETIAAKSGNTVDKKTYTMTFTWPDSDLSASVNETATFGITLNYTQAD